MPLSRLAVGEAASGLPSVGTGGVAVRVAAGPPDAPAAGVGERPGVGLFARPGATVAVATGEAGARVGVALGAAPALRPAVAVGATLGGELAN